MFKRIKKIWQMFCWVIYIKKKWCWPRQSEVLIFDAIHQGIFTEYLGFWDPEVLHRRWEQINMRVLLASFFRSGSRIDAYVDCFIEKVRPRLIITFIDNNQNFYTISKRHPKVKTLFIQNGWRNYYGDIFELFDKVKQGCLEKRKADYKLVFGSMIGKHYSRHVDGDTVPMGSIKNNMEFNEQISFGYIPVWNGVQKTPDSMHGALCWS
jgi:surface carbohydrate biosynthesis protein